MREPCIQVIVQHEQPTHRIPHGDETEGRYDRVTVPEDDVPVRRRVINRRRTRYSFQSSARVIVPALSGACGRQVNKM
eukprot:scaffold7846_cov417-Prasinococcus_capsulatus_cf.AAC.5